MPAHRDAISVRTTRLNNIILSKGITSGVVSKAGRRSASQSTFSVNSTVWDVVSREGLLDAFCLLYSECDKESLKKRDRNIAEFVTKYRTVFDQTRELRVNFDDFIVKAQIGKGQYGSVHLVAECQTGDVYAMKKIKKSVVTTSQMKEERDIMARRCSEWITNLQYAFQDIDHLYLIMEFLPGGDLLSVMSRYGAFDEDLTRFYLAELSLAIHSLHRMGYVHRDIKPENILIDRIGHIKLGDFGNAAALDRDGQVVSLSPVGTPDYIAPELLQTISTYKVTKSLHNVSCDFWSMGIIGYELICEVTPFHEESVHETYSKILSFCEHSNLKEIITYPSSMELSINYKNLIESLITSPTNRLNFTEIKSHKFFSGVKWESLRLQVPPIIPNVNGEDDTSNFDVVARNRGRRPALSKKSPTMSGIKSNDFSGRDLPFIGYNFVHMEQMNVEADAATNDVRVAKLNVKLNELQAKLKERSDEVSHLNHKLLHAEHLSRHCDAQAKTLEDAKAEIIRMKNIIIEKIAELGNAKAQLKKLQTTMKLEAEMWEKKEVAITEMLRMNRQKYEDAKFASELRYEKIIVEKKNELSSLIQKLEARQSELQSKSDECVHRCQKIDNYKEILRQSKLQVQKDREQFELTKNQLRESYEDKLKELRNKLSHEKDSKSRLTLELSDLRTELDDSISSYKSTQRAHNAALKTNDEILKRLNAEIESNNKLQAHNIQLEQQMATIQKASQELEHKIGRLERELQVAECGQSLAQSMLVSQTSPYETAPGSLTDLHALEDQLRADLEAAKESERIQLVRAEELQAKIDNLEAMLENRKQSSSYDQLHALREQFIVERQSARSAHLELWKTEKRLDKTLTELKSHVDLSEERIKKLKEECDDTKLLLKTSEAEKRIRDEHILELKNQIANLTLEVAKQHKMREKVEEERLQIKTEMIGHISKVHLAEERLHALRENAQHSQLNYESVYIENKRLTHELNAAYEQQQADKDLSHELQLKLKSRNDDYERLKYACTITEKQITEVEAMFDAEQRRCKAHQEKNQELFASLRYKDETITELNKQLQEEKSQRKTIEERTRVLSEENMQLKLSQQELQEAQDSQRKELNATANILSETEDRIETFDSEIRILRAHNAKYEHDVAALKEENSQILTDLFHFKKETQRLEAELKEALEKLHESHGNFVELQQVLTEKENFFQQRDIKSEATLTQHKKLIDYLQVKVEYQTHRKKKTIADMLFGSGSSKKENISPPRIKSSILYRTLEEELNREKRRCKLLQEQIDKFKGTPKLALMHCQEQNEVVDLHAIDGAHKLPRKTNGASGTATKAPLLALGGVESSMSGLHHRFELKLFDAALGPSVCITCKCSMLADSLCWHCKECMKVVHPKCRPNVDPNCGAGDDKTEPTNLFTLGPDADATSVGKYSYKAKLESLDSANAEASIVASYTGVLILSEQQDERGELLQVICAYEIEAHKILLLGCSSGLYSYHVKSKQVVHIGGIDSVNCIAVSMPLSKAILVSTSGDSLYQCDFRQLQSRSHANIAIRQTLEASMIELPFSDRSPGERWQQVKISDVAVDAISSVAIAATALRVIILKYDLNMQKFQPVRALDTFSPVVSILYTPLTAIVSSNKFFEIDLEFYAAEEFVDLSDQSLAQTRYFQPMTAISISPRELLLCFSECGIFIDTFGNRSRPLNLNWSCKPTGFLYREPFLYITYRQSVQMIRLHRSYTNGTDAVEIDDDDSGLEPSRSTVEIYLHKPKFLTDSGKFDAYVLTTSEHSGYQQIIHLDPLQAFKQQLNRSFSSISSKGTMLTMDSLSISETI